MDKQTEGQTEGQTDRLTDRQTDRQKDSPPSTSLVIYKKAPDCKLLVERHAKTTLGTL